MKRLLPVLAVLLIAAVSVAVWWATGSAGEGDAVTSLAPDASEPAPAGATSPSALAGSGSPRPAAASADPADDEARLTVKEERRREAERHARWVEGTVVAPGACGGDERVEVFALTMEVGNDRAHELAIALDRGDTLPGWARADFVARAEVDADGAFELPLDPEQEGDVHVTVLGDTLYLRASQPLAADEERVLLEPACGGRLTGRLLAPGDGETLDTESIALRLSTSVDRNDLDFTNPAEIGRSAFSRTVTIAPDGTYEFRGVPAGQVLQLVVESERYAATRTKHAALSPGEHAELDVRLSNGGRIAGRVVDANGAPIAGADVVARGEGVLFGFGKPDLRKGQSGADGAYELAAVPPGKVTMHASATGYLENLGLDTEVIEDALTPGVAIELTSGATIAGTLAWPDGRPAAGATVKIGFDPSAMFGMGAFNAQRGANGEATASDDGSFRATGLGKGPFVVSAEARPADDDDGPKWRVREGSVQPGTEDLALVLEEPVTLAGRVVDQDGLPVTAFEVVAEQVGEGMLGNFGMDKERGDFEDEEGRFELAPLMPGAWQLYVIAEGYGVPDAIDVTLPQPAGEELVVQIERAATVAGIVVDALGAPVGGAEVALDLGMPSWQRSLQTAFEIPGTKSAADGTFLLEGLTPGNVSLNAKADGHATSEPVVLDLAIGEQRTDVTIALRLGATLTGEVFDEEGEAAPGRMIQLTNMGTYDSRMTRSGTDGRFREEHLDPGTWQVVAMPAGFASGGVAEASFSDDDGDAGDESDAILDMVSSIKTAVADLVDGGEEHVVLGAPPQDPVRVFGTVTHDGEPYTGALVTFYAEGAKTMASMRTTRVKKDGAYEVTLDEPGNHVVQIQMLDAAMTQQRIIEFARRIPEGEEYELDFEIPTGRVSGTVEGPGGEPLSGVRVSLHPEGSLETGTLWGGQYAEGSTGADGRYDFQGLRPGRYSLMAGGMAYGGLVNSNASFGRQARSIAIDEGRWLDGEDFRLETPGKLSVKVVDAGGKPVPEAAVFVRDEDGHVLDRLSMITTGTDGTAVYGGLAPGDYAITARRHETASQETGGVRVHSGETTEATLRMEASTLLLITLVDKQGELLNANVSVRDDAGREVSGMVALTELMAVFGDGFSSKEHRVGPLPPGRYKVTGQLADGRTEKKVVTLTGKPERKLTLRFD